MKCKAKRTLADAVEEQMKNGRKAVKGKCPVCGAVMFKILGGKASAPAPAAPAPVPPAEDASGDAAAPSPSSAPVPPPPNAGAA